MKYPRLLPLLLSLSAPVLAQPSISPLSTSEEDPVHLSPFEISSDRVSGYRATESLGGARIRRDLIDTPASISVITLDFINDISATSIVEATQYLSGVGHGNLDGAGGVQERQVLRGFEIYGSTIDNITGLGSFALPLDPQLIERIEILKGPNAALSPSGAPGGTSNVITKSPRFESAHVFKLELADEQFGDKLTLDSTGTVPGTERFAYRVIASYQDAQSYLPGRIVNKAVHPQLTWAITPKTQLKLKGNFMYWALKGAAAHTRANSGPNGHVGNLPIRPDLPQGATISMNDIAPGYVYGGANEHVDWAIRENKVSRGTVEFTTALGEHFNMRLAVLRRLYYNYANTGGVRISRFLGERNPMTGEFTYNQSWALADPSQPWDEVTNPYFSTTVPLVDTSAGASLSEAYARNWLNEQHYQLDVAGKFEFGRVAGAPLAVLHTVMGASRAREWTESKGYDRADDPLPTYDFSRPFLLNAPRPTGLFGPDVINSHGADLRNTKTLVFLNTQLDLFQGRLLLGAGISNQRFNRSYVDWLSTITSSDKASKNLPVYSLLYKVTPWASVYGSHSRNASSTGWFDGTKNVILWSEGKQDEAGVKLEFFERRISVTAAYYELEQTNQVTSNPLRWLDPSLPEQLANIGNKGFELDIVGGITQNLTIIGSYTDMKMRDHLGRQRIGVSDTMYNALVKYGFSRGPAKGLSLFASVNHSGKAAGETPPDRTQIGVPVPVSFYVPERTIFNAGASYDYGPLRFQLNVENLADKKTLVQASGRGGVSPFPGRNIRLTTTYSF